MENDIIFLILQYNNVDVTMNCICSVLKLENCNRIKVIIVDNDSLDGARIKVVENMREICREAGMSKVSEEKELFLFEHESGCTIDILCRIINDGFSKGNNFGFRYIKENYLFKFLIVANNDVEFVQNDFIEHIEREYEKSMFDILGPDIWAPYKKIHQNPISLNIPTIKDVDRTIFLNSVCLILFPFIYPLLGKYMENASKTSNLHVTSVEDVCLQGSCLIYSNKYIEFRKRMAMEKQEIIGNTLFYPETKFYYEEFLQTLWCRKNECKLVYSPDIRVNHLEGQSTDTISTSQKIKIKFKMKNILTSAKIYKKELLKYL